MNSIDEIVNWHPRLLQVWLREIEQNDLKNDLIIAMAGLSNSVNHLILENLSSRIRSFVMKGIFDRKKPLEKVIERAKAKILDIANHLIDIGELSEPDSDEFVFNFKLTDNFKLPNNFKLDNSKDIIDALKLLNDFVQKKGLLALEEVLSKISDPLLSEGLQLIMDGTDPHLVEDLLRNRLQAVIYQKERLYNIIIEGILSIQQGNSNWTLDMKLKSYLPPENKFKDD